MEVSVSEKGYTLSNVSAEELNVVMRLLEIAKNRCFRECDYDGETGMYCDGGDFVAAISGEQRNDFYNFVDGFWAGYDAMMANLVNE